MRIKWSRWNHWKSELIIVPWTTESSCACKIIKYVSLVAFCSFLHLSCWSSFLFLYTLSRTSWNFCIFLCLCSQNASDGLYLLGVGTHCSSYLQSFGYCSCRFVPTDILCIPELRCLKERFDLENWQHIFLDAFFELLICVLIRRARFMLCIRSPKIGKLNS